jgi:dTDP-glucose 4,6-dehydratase
VVPLFITNAIDGQPLPLYGDGLQRRDWLFVDDHVRAIDLVLRHGEPGAVFNVPGSSELTNLELTRRILDGLDRDRGLILHVADRPGHDRRYKMDGSRMAGLGWDPQVPLDEGLATTIDWYRANEAWWRPLKSGDWHNYYARQYAARLAGGTPDARGGDGAPDGVGGEADPAETNDGEATDDAANDGEVSGGPPAA